MDKEEVIEKIVIASNGLASTIRVQESILDDIKKLLEELKNVYERQN